MPRTLHLIKGVFLLALLLTGCRSTGGSQSNGRGSSGGQVINMDEVADVGYSSIEEVLVARVSGVRWSPDGSGIIIRGPRSIQGDNQPLYVVDDVPSAVRPQLNLHDVHEIEVVKDAAALSRFGSRGMHGVILVRTKRGD